MSLVFGLAGALVVLFVVLLTSNSRPRPEEFAQRAPASALDKSLAVVNLPPPADGLPANRKRPTAAMNAPGQVSDQAEGTLRPRARSSVPYQKEKLHGRNPKRRRSLESSG